MCQKIVVSGTVFCSSCYLLPMREQKGLIIPYVCTAPEVIMGTKKITGKKVVVIGSGMTGLETTEILNESGNQVTVVEMAPEIAPGAWFQLVDDTITAEYLRKSLPSPFLSKQQLHNEKK